VLLLAALALPSSLAWLAPAFPGAVIGASLRRPATTGLGAGRSRARGAQLGGLSMQAGESDKPAVEMSEELMLMLAMSERKKLAVPEGGKVLVFGALGENPREILCCSAAAGLTAGYGPERVGAVREQLAR